MGFLLLYKIAKQNWLMFYAAAVSPGQHWRVIIATLTVSLYWEIFFSAKINPIYSEVRRF